MLFCLVVIYRFFDSFTSANVSLVPLWCELWETRRFLVFKFVRAPIRED